MEELGLEVAGGAEQAEDEETSGSGRRRDRIDIGKGLVPRIVLIWLARITVVVGVGESCLVVFAGKTTRVSLLLSSLLFQRR